MINNIYLTHEKIEYSVPTESETINVKTRKEVDNYINK